MRSCCSSITITVVNNPSLLYSYNYLVVHVEEDIATKYLMAIFVSMPISLRIVVTSGMLCYSTVDTEASSLNDLVAVGVC